MNKLISIDLSQNLQLPAKNGQTTLLKGVFDYYHYLCDEVNDRGWGCGYRTLQSMCSWILKNTNKNAAIQVPNISKIQSILVDLEDKPRDFMNSKEWIGSFEVCLVIDQLYDVPCKIIHIQHGKDLKNYVETLRVHFEQFQSLVMMGGSTDCSSKGIAGVHVGDEKIYLLVIDPHFVGNPNSLARLQNDNWIEWRLLNNFDENSFYNLCLPQIKML